MPSTCVQLGHIMKNKVPRYSLCFTPVEVKVFNLNLDSTYFLVFIFNLYSTG